MARLTILALLLATAFGVHGAMMMLAAPIMQTRAASVGFSVTQFRYIGLLEFAAAIAVVAGLAFPALGIAAGVGLVALMTAAVIVHHRNGDPVARMGPAIVLGLLAIVYVVWLAPRVD